MSLSSSVSFRQGANVEFAGPAFVSTGDGKSGQDEVSHLNDSTVPYHINSKIILQSRLKYLSIFDFRLILNSD